MTSNEVIVKIGSESYSFLENVTSQLMGGKIWSGGVMLASYLSKGWWWVDLVGIHREFITEKHLKQKRVLEVGSGCGLNGIVLKQMGNEVVFTDQAPVLSLLRNNLRRNLSGECDVRELDWITVPANELMAFKEANFDVIVGADVIFKSEVVDALLRVLYELSHASTTIYIAEEIRDASVHDHFMSAAKALFTVKQIPKRRYDAALGDEKDFIWLWILKKKKPDVHTD
jgi:predicted nicotinamide N-methyase